MWIAATSFSNSDHEVSFAILDSDKEIIAGNPLFLFLKVRLYLMARLFY